MTWKTVLGRKGGREESVVKERTVMCRCGGVVRRS